MTNLPSSTTVQECLKQEINWRVRFVLNDCLTFIRVRNQQREWYESNKGSETEEGLGGGNFMMAQSLFSALNFLGKAYAHLRHREKYFYSTKHGELVNDAVEQLRSKDNQTKLREIFPNLDFPALLHKKAMTVWRAPSPGDCKNETAVFRMLVESLSETVDFGFTIQEADLVWAQFRNKLAHMAAPASTVETGRPPDGSRSFRPNGDRWICNVECLVHDLHLVASWLCNRIEEVTDLTTLQATLTWIDGPGDQAMKALDYVARLDALSATTTSTSCEGPSYFTHTP